MSQHLIIDLRISADEYQKLYAGVARNVRARARDGRQVQFPADSLRKFVQRDGIKGSFELICDEDLKLIGVHRLL